MASAAAALFVRNDASDISWWIAYHTILGFDALLIFDDNSTDGTWELIQAAAGILPIEAHRVHSKALDYQQRRAESYRQAVYASDSRFDWIICLESDEYVHLEHAENVGSFLDRFSDADGVELHWSIFGSNGHEKHPRLSPLEAYTRRAPQAFEGHKIGKAFIRPAAIAESTLDSLNSLDWELDATRHVASDGSLFDPQAGPHWQEARLLHYAARSQAHFDDRLNALPTSIEVPDLWQAYDQNDEEDLAGKRFLEGTRSVNARIAHVRLNTLFWELKNRIAHAQEQFRIASDFAVQNPKLRPNFDHFRLIHLILSTNATAPNKETEKTFKPLTLLIEGPLGTSEGSADLSRGILLTTHSPAIVSFENPVLTSWQPVTLEPVASTDEKARKLYVLRSAVTGTAYQYRPLESANGNSEVSTEFLLEEIGFTPELKDQVKPYITLRGFGDQLNDLCRGVDLLMTPHPEALSCAIAHLKPQAQETLSRTFPGAIPFWLRHDETLPSPKPRISKELEAEKTVE